jgi:hypothetical protein
MDKKVTKEKNRMDLVANLAVILAALIVIATVVKNDWLAKPLHISQAQTALKGTKLQVPGVNWERAPRTLIMALSTECRFCIQSIPFYKRLTTETRGLDNPVPIIAVFPQQLSVAQAFVQTNQIHPDEVLSRSLQTMGISGTPTLLLVDNTGKVQEVWSGELSGSQESILIQQISSRN